MQSVSEAISYLREALEKVADPEKALGMRAYMKDHFFYIGVQSDKRNAILKEWIPSVRHLNYWELIFALWDEQEREFQYVALELLKKRRPKDFQPDDLYKIRELIISKSWWDTVDLLASDTLGKFLKQYPEYTTQIVKDYRNSENMWLMRSTLIFQLKYKDKTDFELLRALILEFKGIKEFFIQKAIGWSLRQYSKTDPAAVRNFLNQIELKGVAKREAEKYI